MEDPASDQLGQLGFVPLFRQGSAELEVAGRKDVRELRPTLPGVPAGAN